MEEGSIGRAQFLKAAGGYARMGPCS